MTQACAMTDLVERQLPDRQHWTGAGAGTRESVRSRASKSEQQKGLGEVVVATLSQPVPIGPPAGRRGRSG